MLLTKCDEMICGKSEATSIPCTNGPSNPTFRAASESVCKGLESRLTLEYWRTSSSVKTLVFFKTSPGLSTRVVDEKHLRLRYWSLLLEYKLLKSILAKAQFNNTMPWICPSQSENDAKYSFIYIYIYIYIYP